MHRDEPREIPELGPEEVGARVSAILEAAERDARAVISAAYREQQQQQPQPSAGLEELAREVALIASRVEAIERALAAGAPQEAAPGPRRAADAGVGAARVRAVELALAGLSREAIERELCGSLELAVVERVLDDVLSG